jgi:hypothetical protein
MFKLSFDKIVLLTLHLAVWVLLHAFIARITNYLVNYDDVTSIIGLYTLSIIAQLYVFVSMFRQMLCIYVGTYNASNHSKVN